MKAYNMPPSSPPAFRVFFGETFLSFDQLNLLQLVAEEEAEMDDEVDNEAAVGEEEEAAVGEDDGAADGENDEAAVGDDNEAAVGEDEEIAVGEDERTSIWSLLWRFLTSVWGTTKSIFMACVCW